MSCRLASLSRLLGAAVAALGLAAHAAAPHPMDPLDADEILAAANILLQGRAAQPGAIFQSIELREPAKAEVLAFRGGNAPNRSATVFYRQNKRSYKSDRQPDPGNVHAAGADPGQRRPARPDDPGGQRLLVHLPGPGIPERARAARHPLAAAAAEGLRHAADAGLVRPAGGSAPHRQGADVLHRRRASSTSTPGRSRGCRRSSTSTSAASSSSSTPASCRSRRRTTTSTRRASAPATACAPSSSRSASASRRERTSASTATSSNGRSGASTPASSAARAGHLARHLRPAPGPLPGLARRDLRALPGPGRELVLPHLHGRRRVRLRPARLAAPRPASTCPTPRCCSTAWSPRRSPTRACR